MSSKELEDLIVAIMVKYQDEADALADYYGKLLEAEVNKLVSLLATHDLLWQYSPEGQLAIMTIRRRMDAIQAAYTEEVEEVFIRAYEEVSGTVGQELGVSGTFFEEEIGRINQAVSETVAQMNVTYQSRVSELVILMQILPSTTDLAKSLGKITHVGKQIRSFTRKNFKTHLSKLVNTELYSIFAAAGKNKVRWETRPEATESGTCSECKGYASGGLNNDGIYSLEDVPALPAHDHCACVLIPV